MAIAITILVMISELLHVGYFLHSIFYDECHSFGITVLLFELSRYHHGLHLIPQPTT